MEGDDPLGTYSKDCKGLFRDLDMMTSAGRNGMHEFQKVDPEVY